MLGNLDYKEFKRRPYNKKQHWLISVVGALLIASMESFLFEENVFDLGTLFTFSYYFFIWVITLFTIGHIAFNDKKDKYIKGAWFVGVYFLPLVFIPIYYYFRDTYSPKSLNPELKENVN